MRYLDTLSLLVLEWWRILSTLLSLPIFPQTNKICLNNTFLILSFSIQTCCFCVQDNFWILVSDCCYLTFLLIGILWFILDCPVMIWFDLIFFPSREWLLTFDRGITSVLFESKSDSGLNTLGFRTMQKYLNGCKAFNDFCSVLKNLLIQIRARFSVENKPHGAVLTGGSGG